MTTPPASGFLSIFWHSPDRANLCTLTLLSWLAACDGDISPAQEALLRRFASAGKVAEIDMILQIARAGDVEDLEVVCRYAMSKLSRAKQRLLAKLAITVAAVDGQITVGGNHALQFMADLLGISPRAFAKLFQQVTHRPFPEAGDPSSVEWWRRREAGVETEPAYDLPPEPKAAEASSPTEETKSTAAPPPVITMTTARARNILGLSESASPGDIRTAFRRLAKVRHPDRFARLGPSAVAAAAESFKQLDAAYTLFERSRMKDLYKRLGVPRNLPPETLRQAVANTNDPSRADAEYILLNPRRRALYDENHRLLSTIGHLRGRLALGLRPFWSHGNHQDFTQPFVPGARVDPIGVMGAVKRRWEERQSRRIWMWCVLFIIAVGACIWWLRR